MVLRIRLGGIDVPRLNSHRATDYALNIAEGLRQADACKANCLNALTTIQQELRLFNPGVPEHPSRLKAFTQVLLDSEAVSFSVLNRNGLTGRAGAIVTSPVCA
jgi:hypothetical protein